MTYNCLEMVYPGKGGRSVRIFKILVLGVLFFGFVPPGHALTTMSSEGIDACIAQAGQEGLIVSGTFTNVVTEGVYSDNGKKAVLCEVTGKVLKGNSLVKASDDPNTKTSFKIIHPTLVPSIDICKQGETGVWIIYGAGSWGLQSFVLNGDCDIPLEQGPDGKLYAAKPLKFKNMQFKQKFMAANPNAAKLLSGSPGGTGFSQDDVNSMVQGMASQLWGSGTTTPGGGGSASGTGGSGQPTDSVLIVK